MTSDFFVKQKKMTFALYSSMIDFLNIYLKTKTNPRIENSARYIIAKELGSALWTLPGSWSERIKIAEFLKPTHFYTLSKLPVVANTLALWYNILL